MLQRSLQHAPLAPRHLRQRPLAAAALTAADASRVPPQNELLLAQLSEKQRKVAHAECALVAASQKRESAKPMVEEATQRASALRAQVCRKGGNGRTRGGDRSGMDATDNALQRCAHEAAQGRGHTAAVHA